MAVYAAQPSRAFDATTKVTIDVGTQGSLADAARITLADLVDQSDAFATIRIEALAAGKVVATGLANVPEPGATLSFNPTPGFDQVRIWAGESDVSGKIAGSSFTLIPTSPSAGLPGAFSPTKAATFKASAGTGLADSVKLGIADLVDVSDSQGTLRFEGYAQGKLVATGTAQVAEPGGTVTFNPTAGFDEVRVLAGESDVTGRAVNAVFTPLPANTPSPPPSPGTPPQPGTPANPPSWGDFEQRVIDLTNAERAKQGLASLKANAELNRAADEHAEDMATQDYFSHTGLDGSSPGDRMADEGYQTRAWGENIAWGQKTPEAVVSAWMNSPGHRANILNGNFTEIGVGFDDDYWVQNFGSGDLNPQTFIA